MSASVSGCSRKRIIEQAKAHFDRTGVPAKFVNVPFQGRTLHATDAVGTPLEFCARMKTLPRVQTRTHEHKGAGALRMDHFQVLAPDVVAAAAFYTDLGFRVSDYYCAAADRVIGIFMHRKNNPHDMVFLTRSGPRFHHFGYIVPEMHQLCARSIAPAISVLATRWSTGPAATAMGIRITSICAIPTGTGSNCCCRPCRSSISTTSRCATT